MTGKTALTPHLLRGLGGMALVLASLRLVGHSYGWIAFVLMPMALWLLRGCPMCWTVSLFEIIARRVHATTDKEQGTAIS